ncbi:hypothetical protein [Methanocalculus natronophilus]|uniref:hypothetical protein n=1 Tax=Methanocalculus natronophilus TaxID=1262400 RepID=UPI0031B60A19
MWLRVFSSASNLSLTIDGSTFYNAVCIGASIWFTYRGQYRCGIDSLFGDGESGAWSGVVSERCGIDSLFGDGETEGCIGVGIDSLFGDDEPGGCIGAGIGSLFGDGESGACIGVVLGVVSEEGTGSVADEYSLPGSACHRQDNLHPPSLHRDQGGGCRKRAEQ